MAYARFNPNEEPNGFAVRKPMEALRPATTTYPERKASTASKDVLTVQEVAALMGFSRSTVIRLFENERGTIIINRPEKLHKRGYRSIRIPRSVYEHVVRGLSVPESRYRYVVRSRRPW